jgi:integrase/recombinase XerD
MCEWSGSWQDTTINHPDRISEEELRQYFLYLSQVKKVSPSTFQIALSAIKFFFEYTLQRQWATLELVKPIREKKLPVVLSVEEVGRVLARVHRARYRVCLSAIYACGLRLQEGIHLQVGTLTASACSYTYIGGKATESAMCRCRGAY